MMRLVILCCKEERKTATDMLKLLKTAHITATAFVVGEAWKNHDKRLDQTIASATHVVVIYSEFCAKSSWLPFVAGLALGTERPLVLYRMAQKMLVEAYVAPFFVVTSFEELTTFVETESVEWTAVTERRNARRELLDLGVSFHQESLAQTIHEGNLHAIELFIKAGFTVDTKTKKGVPLLCLAAREGHRAVLELLLKRGAAVDLQAEDRGNSALMDAAADGSQELVEILIAAGAALDLQSKDGQTALVLAVGKNNVSLASILLRAGANPDIADKLGFSARKYAKLFHKSEMIDLFEQYPPR